MPSAAINFIATFCDCPGRSVRKTALWSEPPSHCRSGNFPSTRPSHFFQSSGLLIEPLSAKTFYAIGHKPVARKFFAGAGPIVLSSCLTALIAESHFRLLVQYQRPDKAERRPGMRHVDGY